MARRRREQSPLWVKIIVGIAVIAISIMVAVAIAVATPLGGSVSDMFSRDTSKTQEEDVPDYQDVSADTVDRLNKGTILSFGAPASQGKPHITIISDPDKLGRSGSIIGGKPSPLLNAVKDGKITLNLYLIPHGDNRNMAVESVVKAATCRVGAETTNSGIFTVSGIVKVADKLAGNEDIATVSQQMGMKKDAQCAQSAQDASNSTLNNARHFSEQFQTGTQTALIAGNQLITNVDELKDNWVEMLLTGEPASSFVQ